MSGEPGYIRWVPEEWQIVAVAALPHIDKGKEWSDAIRLGQRALPKDRRREDEDFPKLSRSATAQKYVALARQMSETERNALVPPPAPRPPPAARKKLDEGRDATDETRGMVRWTTKEKARIARQVLEWQRAGDTRALSRLIIEAQERVIDPDRRRPMTSIQAGTSGGGNQRLMSDGAANIWLIEADEKREREAAASMEPPPAPTDAAAEAPDATPAATMPTEAPSAPATASETVATPAPTPRTNPALSAAAQAFGETVMGALDKLLRVHAETVLGAVNARMAALSSQTSLEIAAMIEQSMRRTVHTLVEAELGGPIAAPDSPAPIPPPAESAPAAEASPEQAPEPVPEAPPAETVRAPSLKVDVVGLNNGALEQQVRQAFNGNTDFRFVNPDTGSGYAPHRGRHCIIVTHRVPHALKDKIRAAKIEPLYVKSTVGHIVHAVEELHRATGIEMH